MIARLITPNNELLEINIYELQDMFKKIVNTALENPDLNQKFEEDYINKMTKFSKEMEFCIKELGYKIYDPFNMFCKEALVYADRFKIIPFTIANNMIEKNMDHAYDNYDSLNDESIKLTHTINDFDDMDTGLIDDDGFMSNSKFTNREQFAKLYLLNIMIGNKIVAEDFNQNRSKYKTVSEYLVDRLGVAFIIKNLSNKYKVIYNEQTSPKIMEFVQYVKDYEIINNTITLMKIEKAD